MNLSLFNTTLDIRNIKLAMSVINVSTKEMRKLQIC